MQRVYVKGLSHQIGVSDGEGLDLSFMNLAPNSILINGLAGLVDEKCVTKQSWKTLAKSLQGLGQLGQSLPGSSDNPLHIETTSNSGSFPASPPRSPRARVEQLFASFQEAFAAQQEHLLSALPPPLRRGTIVPGEHGAIGAIGQRFRLTSLQSTCRLLLSALLQMNKNFMHADAVPRFRKLLHLLRLVAAPGMGKSTALDILWHLLGLLAALHPKLFAEKGGKQSKESMHLLARVKASFCSTRMLVFSMDLSERDLAQQAVLEQRSATGAVRSHSTTAALRMLRACLRFPVDDPRQDSYSTFLSSMDPALLDALEPMDILKFIVEAAHMGQKEPCIVAFCFDEVNTVLPDPVPTWFQSMMSAFVSLREDAARAEQMGRLAAMPVIMTASTRGAASSLRGTASGHSLVADLQLAPLTEDDSWRIVVDLVDRLGLSSKLESKYSRCPEHISSLLQWLGGNPRLLAYLLCALTGRANLRLEEMAVGSPPSLAWLEHQELRPIIQALVHEMAHSWSDWLNGNKVDILNHAFAHAVLGRLVSRRGTVARNVSWSDLESDNVIQLLKQGSSPVSRTSSMDVDSGSPSEHYGEVEGQEDPDSVADQLVSLCPLLAVAAHQHMEIELMRLVPVPLLHYLADTWRDRELTDVAMFVLKLSLLRLVLREDEAPLSMLYPELGEYSRERIRVPVSNFRIFEISSQLGQLDFEKLLSSTGAWAFLGPDNFGTDSWIILRSTTGRIIVLQIQSKKRVKREALSAEKVVAEADKPLAVPAEQGDMLLLYVTDAARGASPEKVSTRVPAFVVTRPQHHAIYGVGHFIKECLNAASLP